LRHGGANSKGLQFRQITLDKLANVSRPLEPEPIRYIKVASARLTFDFAQNDIWEIVPDLCDWKTGRSGAIFVIVHVSLLALDTSGSRLPAAFDLEGDG
jgi:hypothetical protein